MTSKDLVPLPGKDLALITDETSPVPMWDAEVKRIVTQVWDWVIDKKAFPQQKRDAIAARQTLLQELVFDLDEGRWPEKLPESTPGEWPTPEWETEPQPTGEITTVLPRSILTIADMEDSKWFAMSLEEKLAWANEVTQNG